MASRPLNKVLILILKEMWQGCFFCTTDIMDLPQGFITKCSPQIFFNSYMFYTTWNPREGRGAWGRQQGQSVIRFTTHVERIKKKKKKSKLYQEKIYAIACICISIFIYINIYLYLQDMLPAKMTILKISIISILNHLCYLNS